MRCGIVFEKYYLSRRRQKNSGESGDAEFPGLPEGPDSSKQPEANAAPSDTGLRNLLFGVGAEVNMVYFAGRAILLLIIFAWGMKFIFTPMGDNYAWESFMHLVNLPFHEAGHVLFRLFGRFMAALGGSLAQLLVPLICLLTFLIKTRDAFAASVSLWWLAESLMDIAPYINDARALDLVLLGGVTGKDVEDFHDWEFILRKTGMLEYDRFLAGAAQAAGILLMFCAFAWGGFLLYRQFRVLRSGG